METTDVIICGCGPTGAMLSSCLGRLGVKNICIEKEEAITTDPRGIALDEDGIRALQSIGIYKEIYTDIGRCMGIFKFLGGVHHNLHHPPFMSMDYTTSEGGTGHVGFICHKQPHLEKHIRSTLDSAWCELRQRCCMTAISEDDNWVYATYHDAADGRDHTIRGKFLVGADGKTGFTRKKYLEPKGILMQQSSHTSYEETWVAVNWRISLPTPTSHPDFPLWRLGFAPEDVYDLFFPPDFRFLCNPQRPAVCGRFGNPAERLWRFEFVVRPEEDGNEVAQLDKCKGILGPYITHPGTRYGASLSGEVTYPSDCIETLRSRPFFFSARSCNRWALGRVILCGDSAHVFPPFGGQGIVSGFRDACSLAWRLKVACEFGSVPYTRLLAGWYEERKQQLERSLDATVENGRYVTEGNSLKIFLRDTYLRLIQMVPSWKRALEQGARRHGMCRYAFEPGMHFIAKLDGGLLLPQVYCIPLDVPPSQSLGEAISFTDDEIFALAKHGLFQLVAIARTVEELPRLQDELQEVDRYSKGFVVAAETTLIVMDPHARLPTTAKARPRAVRVATAEEFAASPLCKNRPEPRYYDEYRIIKELPGKRFLIVRPDRFLFAACASRDELIYALEQILPILNSGE